MDGIHHELYHDTRRFYYDHRYMNAYRLTSDLWGQAELTATMPIEGVILAGKLADRLGGSKLSRHLFREALRRDPTHPEVRFHCRYASNRVSNVLDDLRELDSDPELKTDDTVLQSDWYGWQAVLWSMVRNFDRAEDCIKRAVDLVGEEPYILSCKARVLSQCDKWDEAMEVADRAWKKMPRMPTVAGIMSNLLLKKGRAEEAAEKLTTTAQEMQSFDLLKMAIWHQVSLAERASEDDRMAPALKAKEMADALHTVTPLADRFTDAQIAAIGFDVAIVMDDRKAAAKHAEKGMGPFFRNALKKINENPDGERIVIPHTPIRQKHDTCLPASTCTALSHFGEIIDQDELSNAVTYGGTPQWRIRKWADGQGYACRSFTVDSEIAATLVKARIPFVLCYQAETYAHAVTAIGLDERSETLLIHDPSQHRWERFALENLNKDEFPLGPEGMVIVPKERIAEVDALMPADSTVRELELDFWEHGYENGFATAGEKVKAMEDHSKDHPVTRRITAIHAMMCGRAQEGMETLKELLNEHDACLPLKKDLLQSVSRLRNTRMTRDVLESIVERRAVPGLSASQTWREPPTPYLVRYADMLRLNEQHLPKAHRLMKKAIKQDPLYAEVYHVLGDMLDQEHRFEESLLPYRIAADLESTNNHYAEALAYAYRGLGREDEGIVYLRQRAADAGELREGAGAWACLVSTLEEYGRPDQAIAALKEALRIYHKDDGLALFAVDFWSNWGYWDSAAAALKTLESDGARLRYLEGASRFHSRQGNWQKAYDTCKELVETDPENMSARGALLDFTETAKGSKATLALAKEWLATHENDESFEEFYYDLLGRFSHQDMQEEFIRQRLKAQPDDAWAWRELGHRLIDRYGLLPASKRQDLEPEIDAVLTHCDEMAPKDPSTSILNARYLESKRDFKGAIGHFEKALEFWPDNSLCYSRIWTCSHIADREEWDRILALSENALRLCKGHLTPARTLADLIAARFGLKAGENAIERWKEFAPKDPAIALAEAELQLSHGHGQSGREKAIAVLEQAVTDFPHFTTIRNALAEAYLAHLETGKAMECWVDILEREPTNAAARSRLARAHLNEGRTDEALEVVDQGIERDPRDMQLIHMRSQIHWFDHDYESALRLLSNALKENPEEIGLREDLIEKLLDLGKEAEAIELAKEGVEVYPDGAYLWHLLGRTYARTTSSRKDEEEAYKTAIGFNASLLPAVQDLAYHYLEQKQLDEARKVFEESLPSLDGEDLSQACCRMAWITRKEGRKSDAIKELGELTKTYPLAEDAWQFLFNWLEEDEDWDKLLATIDRIPAPLLEDPEFKARTLILQREAGKSPNDLAPEWKDLIRNFPENHYVHTVRFDDLWERERWKPAEKVLTELSSHHPESTFALARWVRVHCHNDKVDAAIDCALKVWTSPGEDELWPESECWRVFRDHGYSKRAVNALTDALKSGEQVRPVAFEGLVNRLGKKILMAPKGELNPFAHWASAKSMKPLINLLQLLDEVQWDSCAERAVVFNKLIEYQRYKEMFAFAKRQPDLCQSHPELWQSMGYALARAGKIDQCIDWYVDWRERPGIRMCFVLDLAQALEKKQRWSDLIDTCGDALMTLEHDHTARYIAFCLCKATLRSGQVETFLQAYHAFRPDDEERYPDNWSSDYLTILVKALPIFAEMSENPSSDLGGQLRELSGIQSSVTDGTWISKAALTICGNRLSSWQRFVLKLKSIFSG